MASFNCRRPALFLIRQRTVSYANGWVGFGDTLRLAELLPSGLREFQKAVAQDLLSAGGFCLQQHGRVDVQFSSISCDLHVVGGHPRLVRGFHQLHFHSTSAQTRKDFTTFLRLRISSRRCSVLGKVGYAYLCDCGSLRLLWPIAHWDNWSVWQSRGCNGHPCLSMR